MLADLETLRKRSSERVETLANAANWLTPTPPLATLATLASLERLTAAAHRLCDLRRDDEEHRLALAEDCRRLNDEQRAEMLTAFLADIERLEGLRLCPPAADEKVYGVAVACETAP